MNRRELLKRLTFVPALVGVTAYTLRATPTFARGTTKTLFGQLHDLNAFIGTRSEVFRGYELRFTGYKAAQNNLSLAGQCVAYPMHGAAQTHFYWMPVERHHAQGGRYFPDYLLPVDRHETFCCNDLETNAVEMIHAVDRAMNDLKMIIEQETK